MALALLILAAGGFWLWKSGRLRSLTFTDAAMAALGLFGFRMLTTGRVLIGALLLATAAGWLAHRMHRASGSMSVDDARALLELPHDADDAAIRSAHRRLIARVHPDAGGSEALARNVNLARDTLLKELRRTGSSRGA